MSWGAGTSHHSVGGQDGATQIHHQLSKNLLIIISLASQTMFYHLANKLIMNNLNWLSCTSFPTWALWSYT